LLLGESKGGCTPVGGGGTGGGHPPRRRPKGGGSFCGRRLLWKQDCRGWCKRPGGSGGKEEAVFADDRSDHPPNKLSPRIKTGGPQWPCCSVFDRTAKVRGCFRNRSTFAVRWRKRTIQNAKKKENISIAKRSYDFWFSVEFRFKKYISDSYKSII